MTKYARENRWLRGDAVHAFADSVVAKYDVQRADWHMRPACSRVNGLFLRFDLAGSLSAGTWDTIRVRLGRETMLVAVEPARGFHTGLAVNLTAAYGSSEVGIEQLDRVSLLDFPYQGWLGKDGWKVQGQ